MKYLLLRLKRFCGFIAGFVFFIAGIFKLLDPVGSGLVVKEYMDFLHLGFMDSLAKPLAFILAFAETVIGTALITGIWRRITAIAAMVFQVFFTIITLILVIYNPQMDCGCFGEVVHLTHLETFLKNIVLLLLLLAFTFPLRYLGGPKKHKYVSFAVVMASVIVFSAYTWMNIPFVDYTAYKPAAALQAGSAFGSAEEDMYEAVFEYERDGQVKEFTLENLPDSTWNFVQAKTIQKQDDKTISLSFYDEEGVYMDTLAVSGRVMVVSLYDMDIKPAAWEKVSQFVRDASQIGFKTLVLVSSLPEGVQCDQLPLYCSDYKTLVSMNRSNGGVTYFSNGYIVGKWSARSAPDMDELEEIFEGDETEYIIGSSAVGSLAFQGFLLYVFAVMLLL